MKTAFSFFVFCLFAVFSVTVKNQLRKQTSPLEALPLGQPMPAFTLPDRTGNLITFGKDPPVAKLTVINFWATWCGPCRMEMPVFEKLYAAKKQDGFLILAINEDKEPGALDTYLKAKPISFPVLVDTGGSLAEKLGIRAFPTTVLVGGDGKVMQVIEGLDRYLEYVIYDHLTGKREDGVSVHTIEITGPAKEKPGK